MTPAAEKILRAIANHPGINAGIADRHAMGTGKGHAVGAAARAELIAAGLVEARKDGRHWRYWLKGQGPVDRLPQSDGLDERGRANRDLSRALAQAERLIDEQQKTIDTLRAELAARGDGRRVPTDRRGRHGQ